MNMTASEMGKRGAKARMKKMTPAQRSAVALAGAKARWAKRKAKRVPS